jgi:DnaK suppressor protein
MLVARAKGECYRPANPMATKSPLTSKDLAELKDRLKQERVDLQAQYDEIEETTFSANQSDLTGEMGFDEEYADAGTATFERERDLSLVNNLRDLMERIDKALAKIDEGTYGLCDRCGRPIEKARLKALPYANLCLQDKQAEERGR